MSLEVRNAQNIAKGISSKNPLKPTNRMLRSKAKVRGKAGREVVDGEVIDPTQATPIAQEPEIYDGTIVKELPRSPKDYIHRIGRTGRAESPGEAISFISPDDQHHFKIIQKKNG